MHRHIVLALLLGLLAPTLGRAQTPAVDDDVNPPGELPGWFTRLDVGILKPHIKSRVVSGGPVYPAFAAPVQLPIAALDWVGAPHLELGYRFCEGAGEVRLGYRLLGSSGTEIVPAFDAAGPGSLHSRLDVHLVNLDYVGSEFIAEGPVISDCFWRDLRAGFGVSAGSAFFDSRARGSQTLDEHSSSSFAGVGPRMLFEWNQRLPCKGISFYSRLEATGLIGSVRQRFEQTGLVGAATVGGGSSTGSQNTGVGIGTGEAGFSWEPEWLARSLRISVGYSWQRWWNLGSADNSNAELTLQGFLLRGEYRY